MVGSARVSLLDPETQRVPGPAEDAGFGDRFERDQRDLDDRRTADRRDLDGADALALRERRDQRVGALDLALQLAALSLRHADEDAAGGAELRLVDLSFPDRRRDDRLAVVEQAHRVERLVAP